MKHELYGPKLKIKSGAHGKRLLTVLIVLSFFAMTVSAYYTTISIVEERSASSRLYEDIISVVMDGEGVISPAQTLKKVEKRRKINKNYTVPAANKLLFNFKTELYEGYEVCYFDGPGDKTIVYFHGGSYMWQPLVIHYDYCRYLADNLGVDVIMPVYPKAPDHNYREVMSWLYSWYSTVSDREIIAFMGDSAGGGIMFSFSQYLLDRGHELPPDLVGFSPCLDLSLSNPEMVALNEHDKMLNLDDLRLKLTFYTDDVTDPYASAMFCDWEKFSEVTVFVGTREIFLADARVLDAKLTDMGKAHNYYEYKNQFHTFSIVPMRERHVCFQQIKAALSN